jgi:hypothetical protein
VTHNPRAIVHTTRGRLGIVVAGVIPGLIMAVTMLTPASAVAAPAVRSASEAPTDSSGSEIAVTGTIPGTDTECTSHYEWEADADLDIGGWSQVEWTSNPCGYSIQERSWCSGPVSYWSTSGVVVSTYLWDKSGCSAPLYTIERGEVRFNYGSGWTTFQTFWTNPLG